MKLTLKGRLPGLNEIINANRTNRFVGAKLKKEFSETIAWSCKAQKIKPIKGRLFFQFRWYEKNRKRDPDNFTSGGRKLILDALQMAGVLENDGWNIVGWVDNWEVDKENPRVEIEINKSNKNIYLDNGNFDVIRLFCANRQKQGY